MNKTALARLRVDALRALCSDVGADPRGTKDALVARLLAVARGEEEDEQQRRQQEEGVLAVPEDMGGREG